MPHVPLSLASLIDSLRRHKGIAHKRDIDRVLDALRAPGLPEASAWIGDDCAALPHGEGKHLLFAIEGFMNEFVAHDPWFAGWCGVMVNLSDIAAMGGRPLAVVDALWSDGEAQAQAVMAGMAAASKAFGVPIVGGHSNTRTAQGQLAVAVLGEAQQLLTSFAARPGDRLVAAIDLRGAYREPFDNWNAATEAPPERLRGDLGLLPTIAEARLAHAGKDISQAGLLGTVLMLMECSRVGVRIDLDRVPRAENVPLERWLRSFPSFGYVLACAPDRVGALVERFRARDISAADIGDIVEGARLELTLAGGMGTEHGVFWNLAQDTLMGITPSPAHVEAIDHVPA
ncbi:sll0787 family AIR synthase-like protein [Azoarcus sp. KH32C]|uniref:sll0787 family AIR synthase-like protein n=1 Tax=Azoarcus sp. KH32C TaxID=748247 RepID=UPI000238685D|nr:sll0787 family AIR synthase-like protein [Azoarcus sp. KH32C]BAL24789.1 putative selenophosphate synthetase-related protein [Azoarcus sp. KH32C]